MSRYFRLCWIVGAVLLLPSISLAQDPGDKDLAGVSAEISYYIAVEDYAIRHADVFMIDEQAVARARFLSRNYEKLFLEASKEYLIKADARKVYRLLLIYLRISTPDHRPPDEQALARYAVDGQSERLRGYAVLLLSHYKSEAALNVILHSLENDRSSLVVGWAASAATKNPTPRVVDTLIAVYDRSEDVGIRFVCAEALGMIGGEKAILTLRKALNDVNPQIREMAKLRLAELAQGNN